VLDDGEPGPPGRQPLQEDPGVRAVRAALAREELEPDRLVRAGRRRRQREEEREQSVRAPRAAPVPLR
jgi:hypothetical protein